jgi:hypothetical protein
MYYFSDGAYFFLHIMEARDFIRLNPNRIYAHYATQFLPIGAMKIFGIKEYAVLSYLYGVNLYLPLVAGLWICYALVRKSNPYLMIFPLLSLFGLSMNSMMHLAAGQAHVISSFFWAIIFYMTQKEKYSLKDYIIFFILVLVFMKSYESAIFLGPLLAAISLPEIFRRGGDQKLFWTAAAILFVASAVIALREILNPYDAGNKVNFLMSAFKLYRHYPAVLSVSFIAAILFFFFKPSLLERYFYPVVIFSSGVTLLVAFGPLVDPSLIKPSLQYSARVLLAYVVPPMGIFFYFVARGRISVSTATWRRMGILTAILIFGQISWNVIAVSQWDGMRRVFKEELSKHRGLLFFEDSMLARERVGNQLISPLVWPWTVTTLSVLWSDDGNVSTIITNKPEYAEWGPFDPMRPDSLPKIERFGFSFVNYREAPHIIDRSYALNKRIIFSKEGNFSRYILSGWSNAEETHVWTNGKAASLAFKMPDPLHDPVIEADVFPFIVPPVLLKQRVLLEVNGEKIGEQEIGSPETLRFTVPRSLWLKKENAVVEFILPDATTARSVGFSDDTRMIALGFTSLTIR